MCQNQLNVAKPQHSCIKNRAKCRQKPAKMLHKRKLINVAKSGLAEPTRCEREHERQRSTLVNHRFKEKLK